MKKGIIELTEQEATVLLQLINISLMTKGFEVSDNCNYFRNKITDAFKEENIEELKKD